MFFKKAEGEEMPDNAPNPIIYGFRYDIGFKKADTGFFHIKGCETIAQADEIREKVITGLTTAMTEKQTVKIHSNIMVDGESISWFLVQPSREWDDE